MLVTWIVVSLALVLAGLWLNESWFQSNWRTSQVAAVKRIDALINAVAEVGDQPDSGLSRADIGDIRADWRPIKEELVSGYGFRSWHKRGRSKNISQDRAAMALLTLANDGAAPLLDILSERGDGPLNKKTIDRIFEVLALDLDELAGKEPTTNGDNPGTASTSPMSEVS